MPPFRSRYTLRRFIRPTAGNAFDTNLTPNSLSVYREGASRGGHGTPCPYTKPLTPLSARRRGWGVRLNHKHMLHCQRQRACCACIRAHRRDVDSQVARCQRQRTVQDAAPYRRQELMSDAADPAANQDQARVEEVDEAGEDFTNDAPAVVDNFVGNRVAFGSRALRRWRSVCHLSPARTWRG
jgi:hypothetical protein